MTQCDDPLCSATTRSIIHARDQARRQIFRIRGVKIDPENPAAAAEEMRAIALECWGPPYL